MEVVGLYGRVSTQEQARDGYSLGEQEERLRKYAEAHGWVVGSCYMDAGLSGANMERAGLQSLIDDVKNHKITKVLVYKLDRLSRRQRDTLYLIEDVFLKNKVDFVSMSETLDTSTPFGMAMIGILSVFAQLERETIKERMILGMDAYVKSGRYRCSSNNTIFGYKFVDNKLMPEEFELEAVKRVYQLFLQGKNHHEIMRIMEDTYPCRESEWNQSRVRRILRNPIYTGRQKWKGEIYQCIDVDPVIDMDTWDQAQDIMKRRSDKITQPQTSHRHNCLLGGMLYCGKCGRRLQYVSVQFPNRKKYRYYRCNGRRIFDVDGYKCDSPNVQCDEIESLVLAEIRKISYDRSIIDRKNEKYDQEIERKKVIMKKIADITAQQKKLIELFTIETIDQSLLVERSAKLSDEKKKLEAEASTINTASPNTQRINDQFDTFDKLIATTTDTLQLGDVIRSLIQSITVSETGTFKIQWNF